jgi:two-component system, OmpR family, alkaline phosphatase synthesis response regulator PhoP
MPALARILVVEDEAHLADGLRFNLEAEGYEVQCVETGEAALAIFDPAAVTEQVWPDLVILDIMLPGIDGFSVARELRERGAFQPILMLTARGRSQDVLEGFGAGADDYLPKPFELSILLVRIQALLRRSRWQGRPAVAAASNPDSFEVPEVYEFRGRRVDFPNLELTWNGATLRLTLMEAQLLRYLIQKQGNVVSRKAILEEVWGVHEDTDTRAIDNFIVRLRRQIEDEPAQPRHLLTVRGVGYRFEP